VEKNKLLVLKEGVLVYFVALKSIEQSSFSCDFPSDAKIRCHHSDPQMALPGTKPRRLIYRAI